MNPPVSRVSWKPCWRVIPSRFAEERVLEKLASNADLEAVEELEGLTNERLRQQRGEAALVPPNDEASGAGSDLIMAQFAYRNPNGGRFSDASFGVYYAAKTRATAVAETKHHREIFMRATREGPMRLEMRAITAELDADLHDIRGMQRKLPSIYSRSSHTAAQQLARDLLRTSSNGVVYDSVRDKGGECAAVFRPRLLSRARRDAQLIFDWDGKTVSKVYELKET